MFVKTFIIAAMGMLACQATPTPEINEVSAAQALDKRACPASGTFLLYDQVGLKGNMRTLTQYSGQQIACSLFGGPNGATVNSYYGGDENVYMYKTKDCSGPAFAIGPQGTNQQDNSANAGPYFSYILIYSKA